MDKGAKIQVMDVNKAIQTIRFVEGVEFVVVILVVSFVKNNHWFELYSPYFDMSTKIEYMVNKWIV